MKAPAAFFKFSHLIRSLSIIVSLFALGYLLGKNLARDAPLYTFDRPVLIALYISFLFIIRLPSKRSVQQGKSVETQ
ncbi:hypothetical protein PAHA111176_13120 [Parendozoicomonas haliclonae]|uniref:Uncharacterized protein n=1 Tax=Parendozoicomonas haliclonae TaxID=1960125 RepID=A0A1X7AIU3_9GAMM|nr:hypothetical protein EHSB41UT_01787 [Parendozoicomonas haliclonae]